MPSWSQKNWGENFSGGFLYLEILGAGWTAMPPIHWLLLCLRVIVIKPSFVHGHQSQQEIIWIAPKKFQKLFRRLAPLTFLIRDGHFGTHLAESFRMSKSSWMMDPTRSREMPSCSAIELAEIRRSSKISSWIWSIISGVVTVLGLQVEAQHRWKNHHVQNRPSSFWRWNTVVHVPLMFLSEWRKFHSAPFLAGGKKLDDSSRLDVVEIVRVAWHASFQPLYQEKSCSSAHEKPLFPTTLLIPSYDIGK